MNNVLDLLNTQIRTNVQYRCTFFRLIFKVKNLFNNNSSRFYAIEFSVLHVR